MQTYEIGCSPTAVDADGVSASQSPGAGAILINGALTSGGVATITAFGAQLIRLTSGGNDSGITFTFTGTNADGETISETVAGTNASNSDTTEYFKTITGVTHTGSVATTVIIGNLITSISPTFKFYKQLNPARVAVGITLVSGTATYAMEDCFTDAPHTRWITNGTVTGKTASFEYPYIDTPCMACRLKVTVSGSGVLKANFVVART
jgi:hypothetical protein